MSTILVTGANGFIGRVLYARLRDGDHEVRAAVRDQINCGGCCVVGDIGPATLWNGVLDRIDTVIHLAARVHVLDDHLADPMREFRRVNVEGTAALAYAAVQAGVRRFVYVSSIKVNGEATHGVPFRGEHPPNPQDSYAVSKFEAEQRLFQVGKKHGLQVVVIRPPLVYGPGVKGNLLRLLDCVYRGIPLPLARVDNRRSLIGVENLVDVIVRCVDHPDAAGEIFLVSDGEDVSTSELVQGLAQCFDRPARLLSVPPSLLRLGARIVGKQDLAQRLLGSLTIDSSNVCQKLNWTPPLSLEAGLARMAEWYLQHRAALRS